MNEQCTRKDLRAIVLIESAWGVDENGRVDVADSYGEGSGDTDYIDYYKCDNCEMTFEPEEGVKWPRDEDAWKAALDHLKVGGVA